MKKAICIIACIGLFMFSASPVSAQVMDNLWFKLKIKLQGFTCGGGTPYAATYTMPAYVHLTWYGSDQYTVHTYTYTGSTWNLHDTRWYVDNENLFFNSSFFVYDGTANSFTIDFVAFVKLKRDSSGTVKSASFKDTGCLCTSSSIQPDKEFAGGCKITAKTIEPGTLPFTP